jgi:hypothetical protein
MHRVRMGKQLVELAGGEMGEERMIAQDRSAIDRGTAGHWLRLLISEWHRRELCTG